MGLSLFWASTLLRLNLNGYPCFPIGISFAGAAPCVVPGLDREGIFFWVMETVLRPPSVSVLRPTFFSEVNYSVMDLEVSSGQVEDTDVRVSLSRFRLIGLSLFWASTLLRWNGAPFECGAGFRYPYPRGRVMCSVVYESGRKK